MARRRILTEMGYEFEIMVCSRATYNIGQNKVSLVSSVYYKLEYVVVLFLKHKSLNLSCDFSGLRNCLWKMFSLSLAKEES